jgi:protein gp37
MTRRLEAMGQKDYAGLTTAKHFNGKVRCLPHKLDIPLRWRKPRRVFVNSMSDLFHEDVPDEFIDRVFAVMALCQQHTFQVLTKRADRMYHYMERDHQYLTEVSEFIDGPLTQAQRTAGWMLEVYRDADGLKDGQYEYHGMLPLHNVWLGVSCEDQQRADERIPWLLKTPAAIRFVSAEPLLGPIDFSSLRLLRCTGAGIDWIIVGGESGPGARPCDVAWIRSIVGRCNAASVPCFVKQIGSNALAWDAAADGLGGITGGGGMLSWPTKDKKGGDQAEWPSDLRLREFPVVQT